MIELLVLAAVGAIGAIGGVTKLLLDATSDDLPSQNPPPQLPSFSAQLQGPRLEQLKRKGMLNPQEMALYIEYLEGQMGMRGGDHIFRVPHAPQPTPPSPEPQTVQGFPMVPHGVSPSPFPIGDSPQIPHDSPPPEGLENCHDEIFYILENNPGISKSQIAFRVFALTREDKSGSPNSRWMKAMEQVDYCLGLVEQAKAQAAAQQLQVLMGGKSA